MDEMLNYIFGELRSGKEMIKRQGVANKRLSLLIVASSIYSMVLALNYHEQSKRIDALSEEIKELRKKEV